jgi:plasmid maintenance system antidote protein VapI
MDALKRFRGWVRRSGSQVAIATALRCHRSLITHILSGRRKPSFAMAVEIERLTGIAASAWKPARRDARTARAA